MRGVMGLCSASVVVGVMGLGCSAASSDPSSESGAGGHAPSTAPDGGAAIPAPDPRVRRSRPDYRDNESGLVAPERLATWVTAWRSSRPRAVEGDLVVLQLDEAEGDARFVRGGEGVRVHLATEIPRLFEARNNGIAAIGRVPASGVRIDSFLRRFGIRPNVDFVLLASGKGNLEDLARAWLVFRYWGFSPESLGILDGTVSALDVALRTATSEAHPLTERGRVLGLPDAGFWLLADAGTVREALGRDLIVDTRSRSEFDGDELVPTLLDTTCLAGAPACTASTSGRIAGATWLPVDAIVAGGGRFRAPAEIESALGNAGLGGSRVHVVYDNDGRTSAVVAFAMLAIAGVPARWYAPSFLEWGSLNATHPTAEARTLPATSAWRTDDTPRRTEGRTTWATADRAIRPLVFDPARQTADRVQTADAEYKRAAPPLPAVGASEDVCR